MRGMDVAVTLITLGQTKVVLLDASQVKHFSETWRACVAWNSQERDSILKASFKEYPDALTVPATLATTAQTG